MRFTKMEGLGNDYIYINCLERYPEELPQLAVRLSQRRFGVGADGVICIGPGKQGDFSMKMYNADGSLGEMCGNGIRCVGKYVFDKGLTNKTELDIDTAAGVRHLTLHLENGVAKRVTVDMGRAEISPRKKLMVEDAEVEGIPVMMGNPHFILFCDDVDRAPVERVGSILERNSFFPNRTNVEFLTVENAGRLRMRVWERGSGETMACGTGACASFAAARELGRCNDAVDVCLPGGVLRLWYSPETGHIQMDGSARIVYEGEL